MRVVIFILLAALLSFNANALAVASDYLEDNTLLVEDKGSKLYGIRLQNPDPGETQLQLTYDDSLSKVIDYEEVYTIPPKSAKSILFNVTAPKKLRPGDTFTIGYTVHQLSGSGSGVPLLLKINKSFNVRIIKSPDKFYLEDYSYAVYAIIALSFLLYIFRKNIAIYWRERGKIAKNILGKGKINKWKR